MSLGVGVYNLTCTATNTNNLTSSCSRFVRVVDSQPPKMSCPSFSLVTDMNHSATFAWPRTVSATDNIGVESVNCTGGPANNTFSQNIITYITVIAREAGS